MVPVWRLQRLQLVERYINEEVRYGEERQQRCKQLQQKIHPRPFNQISIVELVELQQVLPRLARLHGMNNTMIRA